jgi:spermidine synthase
VLLAFVPSSLLLGVTTYLSSEVAVVPLLWILPLALYLLTFILVFARRQLLPQALLARALPLGVAPLVVAFAMQATEPIGPLMGLHLAVFFLAAMLCHGKLAADRPAPAHLTEFYLWLSVGGVLGGVGNALVAPLLFNSVAEYPLAFVVACAVALPRAPESSRADWLWPGLLGALTAGAVLAVRGTRFQADATIAGLLFGVPSLVAFFFSRRPLRFALAAGAILLAGNLHEGEKGRELHAERSFFGVHRVTLDPTGGYHVLAHGKTMHGLQSLDPARRGESLAYYHRTGPAGEVLALHGREPAKKIGAIGLGAGSLASFAQPGQAWTYFEIDPAVEKLARDPRYFTFLSDSPAKLRVVLGDARLTLAAEPDAHFDLVFLDAYSSDAVPVHLATREALALYLRKLAPGGLLALHISNLHLDLEPVFAALARDAHLACLTRDDTEVSSALRALGKAPSVWLVMARRAEDLEKLARSPHWQPSRTDAQLGVWTDDYSSLLSVFRWR